VESVDCCEFLCFLFLVLSQKTITDPATALARASRWPGQGSPGAQSFDHDECVGVLCWRCLV
jgi:hypothetical protein